MLNRIKLDKVLLSLSIFILLVNIVFTSMPLVNLLGYESSSVNGILLSLVIGLYWTYNQRKMLIDKLSVALVFSTIPFIVLSISTILCQKCPLDDGIYFYIALIIPSIIVGITIAEFVKYSTRKYKWFFFIIIWFTLLLGFLPELYFNPQIYFYNPIFGYYPGVIYDQGIEITSTLVLYRVITVLICLLILAVIKLSSYFNKYRKHIVFTIVIAIYFMSFYLKNTLGFTTEISNIKSELSGYLETDHFTIIYPDSLTKDEIALLRYDHEFYYSEIKELLGVELQDKITSFVFESGAQKKKLFGAANADVAKPWLNQIYLNYNNLQNSLKHEIVHIFSAVYTSNLFKIPSSFNPGLIEGFAMAIENNYDDYDIDYLAALAYQNDYKISIVSLYQNLSFFSNASSLSYIYSGAFLKFLADHYGWDKIQLVYNNADFFDIYNIPLSELEEKFNDHLSKIKIEENPNKANYYFGRTPLIKKFCARVTAKELKRASEFYADSNFSIASQLYYDIYSYSGSYSALVGYVFSQKEMNQLGNAISYLEEELNKYRKSSSYYYLQFVLADFYALNRDSLKASEYYGKIIEENPHPIYLSSAKVKQYTLKEGNQRLIEYMTDKEYKYQKLKEILQSNPCDEFMQQYIRQNVIEKSAKNEMFKVISQVYMNTQLSSETYYLMSKFAFYSSKFKESLVYVEAALNSSDFSREVVIREHLNKINWVLSITH